MNGPTNGPNEWTNELINGPNGADEPCDAVDEKGRFFNAFVVAFGFVGFWSQFWSGFALPFPLNILLIPVRLAEWGLRILVFMLG